MDYNKLASTISIWIKDYVNKNHLDSLVIGISGGVDSAVTSTLAAMTGLPTYAMSMPIHQKSEQLLLADQHIDWLMKNFLNVKKIKIDLSTAFDQIILSLANDINSTTANNLHAQANTRSRLRMLTLYHIAAAHQGIVVGTGNKVEDYGIGFFTKYGDGGVDIAPIADLYKSEVYALAKTLNVITEIQQAPPTDGLWDDGRNDEDQIGCSYKELEEVMRSAENSKKQPPSFSINDQMDNNKAENIFIQLNRKNQHKMRPIPTFILNDYGFNRSII